MSEESLNPKDLYGTPPEQPIVAPTAQINPSEEKKSPEPQPEAASSNLSQAIAVPTMLIQPNGETFGETITPIFAHQGVNLVGNEIGSIAATVQLQHGEKLTLLPWWHKEGFEAASKWLAENTATSWLFHDYHEEVSPAKFAQNVAREPDYYKQLARFNEAGEETKVLQRVSKVKNAQNLLMTAGLLVFGTALVPVVKTIEDHKAWWARKFNHAADSARSAAGMQHLSAEQIAERDRQVDARVAAEPKATWWDAAISRIFSVVITMGFGHIVMGEKWNGRAKDFSEDIGIKASGLFSKSFRNRMLEERARERAGEVVATSTFRHAAQLVGPETIYCGVASTGLQGAMAFLSKSHEHECPQPEGQFAFSNSTAIKQGTGVNFTANTQQAAYKELHKQSPSSLMADKLNNASAPALSFS